MNERGGGNWPVRIITKQARGNEPPSRDIAILPYLQIDAIPVDGEVNGASHMGMKERTIAAVESQQLSRQDGFAEKSVARVLFRRCAGVWIRLDEKGERWPIDRSERYPSRCR